MPADIVLHPADYGLSRGPARLKPAATTSSVCGFCRTGCALKIHLNADGEAPACDDGIDNDRDGAIDWDGGPGGAPADAYCDTPTKGAEGPSSSCGLGTELALLLPLLFAWRRRRAG